MSFAGNTKVFLEDGMTYDFLSLIKLANAGQELKGVSITKSGMFTIGSFGLPTRDGQLQLLQLELSTGDIVECSPLQGFLMGLDHVAFAKDLKVGARPWAQMGGDIHITRITPCNGLQDMYSLSSVYYDNYQLGCGLIAMNAFLS